MSSTPDRSAELPSTSVAEITQESLQQILLVVREEMKQMRADILDAHNPAPARPQSHWFGTASSFPSFDNQTHPLDSPWHQFQTMQQQQQAVQQLQLQLQHRIQQEMYTLQQVQLVTQQQLQETQQQLQKMIHLVQQKQVVSDATTSEQAQQLQEMRAAHQTLQKEVVTMKNDLIDLKAKVKAEDASEMDRIADDKDVQDECTAPEDLDEDEYATTEDLDRLIQRVEALECDIFPEQELAADELPPEHETLLQRVAALECDIFPEQELAADEFPPEHETLLSRVMTLKSDFGTCAKQADLAELYARIERLEREDGKAPEHREQAISNPSITRHTQTNPSGYRGDRGSKSNGPRREQATAQAQSAVTTQLTATEQVATQGQVAVAKQAGRKVAEHPQAAAQEQAGTAYKEASPILASNTFSLATSYLSHAHPSSPPVPSALQHTQLTPPGFGGGRGGQLVRPPQAVTNPES